MIIVNKYQSTQTVITGRLSNGSDRQETVVTTYLVTVKDAGRTLEMKFDHDPTDDELAVSIGSGNYKDVTTLEEQIIQLKADYLTLKNDNLILMDVLATMYEDMLAKGTV